MQKPERPVYPTDLRCELAKDIYAMTAKQQARFREQFPMGFTDDAVEAALVFADTVLNDLD